MLSIRKALDIETNTKVNLSSTVVVLIQQEERKFALPLTYIKVRSIV